MNYQTLIQQFGLSEKTARVYLALLERGPSSIRQVAEASGINRQTTHELLRQLTDKGLVTFYQERSREAFLAEDPSTLMHIANEEVKKLEQSRDDLAQALPQLKALRERARGLATVHFYANLKGVRTVLEDVLATSEQTKNQLYRVYSSAIIAPFLYEAYPNFTKDRIHRKVNVRVMSLGGKGKPRGLDERKQLTENTASPSYIFIYGPKVAMISLDEHRRPRTVLIEDRAIAESLALIFDTEWKNLKE
ncbi:MAG: helix-turn-helix domain-containing protein [Patescibacteria group bacterium]